MSKLYLYAVFHGNLNFSYIPKDFYPQIVRRCYWPLLRIVEEQQVPLGLEFSGYTLEVINSLDPSFIKRLKELWHDGACEVVGSGYVQAIMPLIPARVNRENLRYGNEVYQALLGKRPSVAFANELVYSAGLTRLYRDAGYEAMMANWESAFPVHADPELLFRPCAVPVGDGDQLPLIWHSIEAYRNFQRYVEREVPLEEYLSGLLKRIPAQGQRAFPMYSSDWEVFDFKPWRAQPDGFNQPELGEMARILDLLTALKARAEIEFVTPSSLLAKFPDRPLVRPESSAYPLPYKKQDQHAVTRWAVGGRDGVRLNTQCHQLYQELLLADWRVADRGGAASPGEELGDLWRELGFLWNSDFRTFTTEEKYLEFRNRMGAALDRAQRLREGLKPSDMASGEIWLTNCSPVPAEGEPVAFDIGANGAGTGVLPSYELQLNGRSIPCQVTRNSAVSEEARLLTLEAQPPLAVGESGVGVVRRSASSPTRQRPDHQVDRERHIVETPAVRLHLLPESGGAIESLSFPGVSSEPLVRRIQDGTAELVPGDLTLEDWMGRDVSDKLPAQPQYPEPGQEQQIFVPVHFNIVTEVGNIWKTYRVYLDQARVDIIYRFQWRDVVPKLFRLGRMVLNPDAFDMDTLYYATTNGGEDVERFALKGQHVGQDEPLETEATANGCLGATEGWMVVGDNARGVGLVTRPAGLCSVPLVHYEGRQDSFLLWVTHTLGEKDDTSHTLWRGHSTWSLSILGGGEDVMARTRDCALLSNGGLVVRSQMGENPGVI